MQDSRMPPYSEAASSRRKKNSASKLSLPQLPANHGQPALPLRTGKKASKRNHLPNEVHHLPHPPEISNSDSLPDSSSGNEYRALRRNYLLLEEESFAVERELKEVEGEVKFLEEEKLALLDRLVVLEGLIDSSVSHLQSP